MKVAVITALLAALAIANGQTCEDASITKIQTLFPGGSHDKGAGNMGHYTRVFGNIVIAGAYGDTGWQGSVHVFEKTSSGAFSFLQRLRASDPYNGAYFGLNIGLWENTIVVGAPFTRPRGFAKSGSAYIFERQANGLFSETHKLVPDDSQRQGFYGYSVNIERDTVIIGARNTNNEVTGTERAGKVYVYNRQGSDWSLSQQLRGRLAANQWGDEIRIAGDVILVGAPRCNAGRGCAFVFIKNGDLFSETQMLRGIEDEVPGDRNDHWGEACALSPDGNTLIIGGESANSDRGVDTGAAQLYEREGNTFVFRQYLYPNRGGKFRFGQRAAVRNNMAVVTAWTAWNNGPGAGIAYVYVKCSDGRYNLQEVISDEEAMADDNFGKMVDLSDEYMVIGAAKDDNNGDSDAGAVHLYSLTGEGPVVTATPSASPSVTPTPTPTATPLPSFSPTPTPFTPTPTPTATPLPSFSPTPTPLTPTPTPTPTPGPPGGEDFIRFSPIPESFLFRGESELRVEYQSNSAGREMNLLVKMPSGQTIVWRVVPIDAGTGVQIFTFDLSGRVSVGDNVKVRVVMWEAGTGFGGRVVPLISTEVRVDADDTGGPTTTNSLAFAETPTELPKASTTSIIVNYSSAEANRVINMDIRVSGQSPYFWQSIPIPQGSGQITFNVQMPSRASPGETVRVRVAMWPEGGDWPDRVMAGLFSSATVI